MYNKRGAKYYYSHLSNQRVAASRIPKHLLDKIQPKDTLLDVGELNKLKNGYLKELSALQDKIHQIDLKLARLNIDDPDLIRQAEQKAKEREERTQQRKRKLDQDEKERLRKLFEEFSKRPTPHPDIPKPPLDILSQHGITTKAEWKQWLLKHHPDKGGNEEVCQDVIAAGRSRGW